MDYTKALVSVAEKWNTKLTEEKKKKEAMTKIVVAIAFLPAGPIMGAVAEGLSAPLIAQLSKLKLDAEAMSSLTKAFNPEAAKKALEKGADVLKEKAVEFSSDSDKAKTIGSFLWPLNEKASVAIHDFIDRIAATEDISEAIGFYNLYRPSLLNVYFATVDQQVTDMLNQIAPVAEQEEHDKKHRPDAQPGVIQDGVAEEIIAVHWKGQDMLARAVRIKDPLTQDTYLRFKAWVTPDMHATAATRVRETVSEDVFKLQRVPDPDREDGERIVTIGQNTGLAIVTVHRGKLSLKEWVTGHDTAAAQARGLMQNGGIENVAENDVARFVSPPAPEKRD